MRYALRFGLCFYYSRTHDLFSSLFTEQFHSVYRIPYCGATVENRQDKIRSIYLGDVFQAEERREGRRGKTYRRREKEEGKVKKKSARGARRISARDQIRSRRELGRCGCVVNETWIAGGEHPLRFTPQFLSNHAATACASPSSIAPTVGPCGLPQHRRRGAERLSFLLLLAFFAVTVSIIDQVFRAGNKRGIGRTIASTEFLF